MNAKRLAEVRALVAHPDFQGWWRELLSARGEREGAERRYEDLLAQTTLMEFKAELTQKNAIDTLYRAGESEDAAANMYFESTELENRSFAAVADFEEQRYRVSELWYRLGATERELDEKREAQRKAPSRKAEAEQVQAERAHRSAAQDYERETARKNRLWDEVERIWDRSAEVNLLVAEHRIQGKKVRRQAESFFALAEERKARSRILREEAEAASQAREAAQAKVRALLDGAKERFGCGAGEEFLYFRQKDNPKRAYCVSLVDDREHYNIEVQPLQVYVVDRQRGVAFLEPARMETPSAEEGDRRFEEYFLRGRKGEPRAAAGSAP